MKRYKVDIKQTTMWKAYKMGGDCRTVTAEVIAHSAEEAKKRLMACQVEIKSKLKEVEPRRPVLYQYQPWDYTNKISCERL